jgi:uncharacterized membrane protein
MPEPTRREHQVTRLEGFSDAVFGFALTLLVVSLEVPSNFEQLTVQMQGFLAFGLMFAMVCWIWYEHNAFFRLYGLQDRWTVFLNCVLLFVVLFYVYPLKFLTQALMHQFLGIGSASGPRFGTNVGGPLMMLYSTGVVLIFGVFVLLYVHAWRGRADLHLTRSEETTLRFSMQAHMLSTALGVVSLAIVVVRPNWAAIAGMLYALMGPLHAWNGYRAGVAHELLKRSGGADAQR